jgi:hypothetical protein
MPVSFNPIARSASGTEAPVSNRRWGNKTEFSKQYKYPANHQFPSINGNASKSNLWITSQNKFQAYLDPANKERRGSPQLASVERKRILAKIKANEEAGKSYSIYDIRDKLHASSDPTDNAAGDVLNTMILNLVSSNIDINSMEFNAANLTAAAKSGESAVHAMIASKVNSTKGGRNTRRKRKAKKSSRRRK